jgi:hypothetical protein
MVGGPMVFDRSHKNQETAKLERLAVRNGLGKSAVTRSELRLVTVKCIEASLSNFGADLPQF